jgi:CheY-like chemotaxis protein
MAGPNKETDLELVLKDYLSTNSVLIVDSVSSARVSLAATLAKFGATRQKMSLVGSIAEARREIIKLRPKVVFTDFMIGSESGLDLLQDQKLSYSKEELKETTFVLVTGNASQSTVARAAEEDVDTFIIKPYTLNTLRNALANAVNMKLHPNKYLQLIEAGKELLFKSNYDEAIKTFEEAMDHSETPTLACFYAGQAEFMKTAIVGAEKNYDQGLSYNKIHYKCLVGLYDLLMSQKKYFEAYDIIKRLAQYFPANPKRLASVLRLAIITENFDDMEGYYRIFLKVSDRTEELTKYMCSALLVTGKHYLRRKIRSRALELFEAAAVSGNGKSNFLAYIIDALVDYKMRDPADAFLVRMGKVSTTSADYLISRFLISTLFDDLLGSIQMGRNLIREGHETPAVYEKLIAQSVKGEYMEAAEELYVEACKKWPNRTGDFVFAREVPESA